VARHVVHTLKEDLPGIGFFAAVAEQIEALRPSAMGTVRPALDGPSREWIARVPGFVWAAV
jgi:hypothetical protein